MAQSKPTLNQRMAVWDQVILDIQKRDEAGVKTYGTRLQPFNGRSSLSDAYEEALDLSVYLKQRIIEDLEILPQCFIAIQLALSFGQKLGDLDPDQIDQLKNLGDQIFKMLDEDGVRILLEIAQKALESIEVEE